MSVPRVAVVPGDGIGVEVIAEAIKALHAVADASGKQIRLTPFDWGAERYLRTGTSLPAGALQMLQSEFDAILLGAMGDPRVPDNRHAAGHPARPAFRPRPLRQLQACPPLSREALPPEGAPSRRRGFRGLPREHRGAVRDDGGNFKKGTADEVATEVDLNTRKGVERIIRHAFAFAARTGRKKVVMADKSNVLVHAHDLWQRVFKEVAGEHPSVEATHLYVDNLALQLVRDPRQFEVIVTSNMFGDIVTDLAAGLQGGLGMAASGNLHPGRLSLFEPVHGSSPPLAGRNVANPMGAILTAGLMLEHLGWKEEASRIEAAVRWAVEADVTTADIGGAMGTREVGDAIEGRLRGSGRASLGTATIPAEGRYARGRAGDGAGIGRGAPCSSESCRHPGPARARSRSGSRRAACAAPICTSWTESWSTRSSARSGPSDRGRHRGGRGETGLRSARASECPGWAGPAAPVPTAGRGARTSASALVSRATTSTEASRSVPWRTRASASRYHQATPIFRRRRCCARG